MARERTKKIRTRVHSETQVVAVRTQQQRDAKNQLLASKSSLAGKRSRGRRAACIDTQAGEGADRRGERARGRGRGYPRPARRGPGSDATRLLRPQGLIWPVSGPVTSPFGYRWGRLHAGIDIGVPYGTPIHAAASGTVVLAGWTGGYGNYTCIDHGGGMATCYAHQSSYAVSTGAQVSQGQVIGYVGQHGPQLRRPPALRGPDQREPGGSSGLPLGLVAVPGSRSRTFTLCNSYPAGVEDRVVPRYGQVVSRRRRPLPGAAGCFPGLSCHPSRPKVWASRKMFNPEMIAATTTAAAIVSARVHEHAHDVATAREHHQRDQRERDPEREHDLADHERPRTGRALDARSRRTPGSS